MPTEEDLGTTRTRGGPSPWSAGSSDDTPPPERIGAYRLLRALGEGGMGVVYAAYHEDLDRKVALKLVHREGAGTVGGRAQILREAQALARLSHPNVVQVYEVGEHEGQLFVAMEHVHGETLEEWQRRPGRRLGELLDAYRQAATGLKAAHDAGLVHRDFKPANAIVGADGRVRVLDFGLARARRHPPHDTLAAPTPSAGTLDRTVDDGVAGTPAYMSPEQFEGRELDARSDIFSLCVALWEALHGRRPFAGETFAEIEANVTAGRQLPAPQGLDLPGRLRHALTRGLERDREARWSTLGPLIEALAADPDADPTAAGRERQIFFSIFAAMLALVAVPLLALGVTGHVDRRILHALISGCGLATVVAVGLAFRRALLRNAYHRRMILFVGALMLVVTAQRGFALVLDTPVRHAFLADAHVLVAMCLAGAIFFARWMLVLAAIVAVAVVAGLLVPGLFPAGMLVVGPLFVVTFGYFWRREARRGVE